jgi:hypothetical protein
MNPTSGFGLKTFSSPAVVVHITSQVAGAIVTSVKRSYLILNSTTVHTVSAIAASIWLAVPNSGHSVQIPPNGSITPTHRSVAVSRLQNRKRNPTVGSMLLRWRKLFANPLFTCENMKPA